MGKQDNVLQVPKLGWNVRFIGKYIESGAPELSCSQSFNKCIFVDDFTPRDVDERAFRPERGQNGRVDEATVPGAARTGDDEDITIRGQSLRIRVVGVSAVCNGPPGAVTWMHAHRFGAAGDSTADMTESEHS